MRPQPYLVVKFVSFQISKTIPQNLSTVGKTWNFTQKWLPVKKSDLLLFFIFLTIFAIVISIFSGIQFYRLDFC